MATVEAELAPTRTLLTMLTRALDKALPHARQLTERGRDIDAYQVHCERLAYRATELRAAQDLLRYAEARLQHGQDDEVTTSMALAFAAEASQTFLAEAEANLHDYGFTESFVQIGLPTLKGSALSSPCPEHKTGIAKARSVVRIIEFRMILLVDAWTFVPASPVLLPLQKPVKFLFEREARS